MTNNIDDKLKALGDSDEHNGNCTAHGEGQLCCLEIPEVIEKIKAVFAEAGYYPDEVMSGREWYEKYRYLCMSSGYYSDELPMMKLAREASGLTKTDKEI